MNSGLRSRVWIWPVFAFRAFSSRGYRLFRGVLEGCGSDGSMAQENEGCGIGFRAWDAGISPLGRVRLHGQPSTLNPTREALTVNPERVRSRQFLQTTDLDRSATHISCGSAVEPGSEERPIPTLHQTQRVVKVEGGGFEGPGLKNRVLITSPYHVMTLLRFRGLGL